MARTIKGTYGKQSRKPHMCVEQASVTIPSSKNVVPFPLDKGRKTSADRIKRKIKAIWNVHKGPAAWLPLTSLHPCSIFYLVLLFMFPGLLPTNETGIIPKNHSKIQE